MLEYLKKQVYEANMELVNKGLVIYTWGNVSARDSETGLIVIKPSGVDYDKMKHEHMVVVDSSGKVIEGNYKPSSDLYTHLEIYAANEKIMGVAHTHSTYATSFAQAGIPIPVLGTTHADYFYGDIPCTRQMTKQEIEKDYELNTGKVIVETFQQKDMMHIPACLVKNHGPFTWGSDPHEAVFNSVVLEQTAKMAYLSLTLNSEARMPDKTLLDKHYLRKHGSNAYYGQ